MGGDNFEAQKMIRNNDPADGLDRRTFLRNAGASAIALSTATGVGSAEPGFHEIIEQAQQIRVKTGSQERFLQHLRKHDLGVVNKHDRYSVPKQASNDVSTQELDDANLDTNLSLVYRYYQCSLDDIYTEYSWDWSNTDGFGEPPKDYISLGWPTDHYDYQSQTNGGSDTSLFDRSNSLNGAIWDYEDNQISSGGSDYSYAGCYLKETTTDQDRHIGGKYRHTFQDVEITGWGFSSDGSVSMSFSPVDHAWRSGFKSIYESEADHQYTNC